jgi:hypothetical protein
MFLSCLAYSLTLKTEAVCSSEISDSFKQTTQHYILEDRTLHCITSFIHFFIAINVNINLVVSMSIFQIQKVRYTTSVILLLMLTVILV